MNNSSTVSQIKLTNVLDGQIKFLSNNCLIKNSLTATKGAITKEINSINELLEDAFLVRSEGVTRYFGGSIEVFINEHSRYVDTLKSIAKRINEVKTIVTPEDEISHKINQRTELLGTHKEFLKFALKQQAENRFYMFGVHSMKVTDAIESTTAIIENLEVELIKLEKSITKTAFNPFPQAKEQIKNALKFPKMFLFSFALVFISFASMADTDKELANKAAQQGIELNTLEVANMLSFTADKLTETQILDLALSFETHFNVKFDTSVDAGTYKAVNAKGQKLRLKIYHKTATKKSKVILTVIK